MAWVAVGIAAGATTSYLNNQKKKKQEQADMMANSEAMRYSPWTGARPTMMTHQVGSDLGAAVGGGMQGAMIGAQLGKLGGTPSPSPSPVDGADKLSMPSLGADAATPPPAPGLGMGNVAQNLQSPNMMSPQEYAQLKASGQLAQGSQGSPWSLMANQKKPNMYGY